MKKLDFDTLPDADNGINRVYARLEYSLTKAFLRYCEGQRFGFTNPYDLFNRLDVRDSDSVHVSIARYMACLQNWLVANFLMRLTAQ